MDWGRPGSAAGRTTNRHSRSSDGPPLSPATATQATDALGRLGVPARPDPPWLHWAGDVPSSLAQRIACDSNVWRAVLDPATGLPLDVGRAYRIVPHWIRKALHARDRGCRWPGCDVPAAWTDAHHVLEWYYGGRTNLDEILLLCRWHHMLVHEGQWSIAFDQSTAEVAVTRPDGSPYELDPTRAWRLSTTGTMPAPSQAPPHGRPRGPAQRLDESPPETVA